MADVAAGSVLSGVWVEGDGVEVASAVGAGAGGCAGWSSGGVEPGVGSGGGSGGLGSLFMRRRGWGMRSDG